MNSMKVKFAILILIAGLLTACGSQVTEAPASQPTEAAAPATEAPTQAAAATEPPSATEAPTSQPVAGASVSFATDVLPLLDSRCVSCHGGDRTSEGLSLKSYAELMAGSENGPVVAAGDAANSLLAQLVSEGKMPKRGPKLTPAQVQAIIDWINQGAQNN